jgi:hypothetical protein
MPSTSVRIPTQLYDAVRHRAEVERRTAPQMLRILIEDALEQQPVAPESWPGEVAPTQVEIFDETVEPVPDAEWVAPVATRADEITPDWK